MVPAGRGTLLGTFNMKVLAWCMGSGSHRQLPGLASSSLQVTDAFFIGVYTTELLLKLYVDPIAYWKSGYDILDAAILLVAFLPHILPVDTATCTRPEGMTKGLQTLSMLKLIKYSSGMRMLLTTLGQTVQTVTGALILLFLLMFVFAILGHGCLKAAVFTLFSLVTVGGWTDTQCEMDHYGFTSSHVFIVVFILLGNFIFFNTLIALVITKTQGLDSEVRTGLQSSEGDCCLGQETEDPEKAGEEREQPSHARADFSELLDDIKKTLRHSDIIIMEGFCFTIPFIDLYLLFLDLQDDTPNSSYRVCDLQGLGKGSRGIPVLGSLCGTWECNSMHFQTCLVSLCHLMVH
ncbi:cation channel sperm-associated protein 3 [Ciconia boyciana]|uniref:cation channel sperm-associated protein 3 n=1 Tax=Ciconia boyciana TaxID=52775 RepID=UPI003B9EB204